jgi:hypothetical protein
MIQSTSTKTRNRIGVCALFACATPMLIAQEQHKRDVADLYQLQAAFHRAASVSDPINGDSTEVIDQRVRDVLALFTNDAFLVLSVGNNARDGNYVGRGDPSDPSTCPQPSTTSMTRGTLCSFFKYVSGSFQPANKFVSLAPSYKTSFEVHGQTATVYFECHYFNVAADSSSGAPLWSPASRVVFDGGARKVDGRWLFTHVTAPAAGVPLP